MSDDIIKRLREAIAAGPTPGYWDADFASAMRNGSPAVVEYFVRRDGDDISIAADIVDPSSGLPSAVNANYIAAASPDNIAALLDRLDAAERENERLRKFAGKVLDKSREEFLEMSCGDIEDWAKQFGLLGLVTMSAACGDDCKCAELADFPLECPRPTALGSAAIDAAMAAERGKE